MENIIRERLKEVCEFECESTNKGDGMSRDCFLCIYNPKNYKPIDPICKKLTIDGMLGTF